MKRKFCLAFMLLLIAILAISSHNQMDFNGDGYDDLIVKAPLWQMSSIPLNFIT